MEIDHAHPAACGKLNDIRLIVFDLDGTLVNAFDDIAAAANHALSVLGRPALSKDVISQYVGHGGRNLMSSCLGDGATEEETERAFAAWRSYYAKHPADFAKPYPGVEATLKQIRQRGIRTAVISNKLDELTRMILKKMDLERLFDAIQGELPGKPRKPDPDSLRHFMRIFSIDEGQTLMVGDGDADMDVANNAGVLAIGVSYGVSSSETLCHLGAKAVIGTFPEILDLLN